MRRRELIILVVGLVIGLVLGVLLNEETSLFGAASSKAACKNARESLVRHNEYIASLQATYDTAAAACNNGDQAACTTMTETATKIAQMEQQIVDINKWIATNCN